jgi:hypothetical protein
VPEGVSVSADGLAVSRVGTAGWKNDSALVEPAFSSAERCYAEWVIQEADTDCQIMIGVTDLDAAPPARQSMFAIPGSRMYDCSDSRAWPGNRNWGATGGRARGDRVGLLVERGGVSVYVNGVRLGPGPMATDLPQRVRRTARARAAAVMHAHTRSARAICTHASSHYPKPCQLPFCCLALPCTRTWAQQKHTLPICCSVHN